jgi:hypothetical protein
MLYASPSRTLEVKQDFEHSKFIQYIAHRLFITSTLRGKMSTQKCFCTVVLFRGMNIKLENSDPTPGLLRFFYTAYQDYADEPILVYRYFCWGKGWV